MSTGSAPRDALERIATLLRQQAGLTFEKGRMRVLETRLSEVADSLGCQDLEGLWRRLLSEPPTGDAWRRVVDQTVTDETSWFRYRHYFDALQHYVLPAVVSNKSYGGEPTVRILSAGCSRGHEPYSLAMMIDADEEMSRGSRFQIDAVDISDAALRHAQRGVYSDPEMRGLPKEFLDRYFVRVNDGWELSGRIRARVSFRRHNLLAPVDALPYDVVFCCNVLIYFDRPDSRRAIENLCRSLVAGGHLFVGHAESYHGVAQDLYQVQLGTTIAYRRRHLTPSGVWKT